MVAFRVLEQRGDVAKEHALDREIRDIANLIAKIHTVCLLLLTNHSIERAFR
ncbi:hypothetical protein SDC9_89678 [bioreactor metagenome]|uniref:Uncharacterized protein n=1 Tax=bioreactor metagenome TaxID=1076179 RepID=A0A644ZQG9_9ZZZZ